MGLTANFCGHCRAPREGSHGAVATAPSSEAPAPTTGLRSTIPGANASGRVYATTQRRFWAFVLDLLVLAVFGVGPAGAINALFGPDRFGSALSPKINRVVLVSTVVGPMVNAFYIISQWTRRGSA